MYYYFLHLIIISGKSATALAFLVPALKDGAIDSSLHKVYKLFRLTYNIITYNI